MARPPLSTTGNAGSRLDVDGVGRGRGETTNNSTSTFNNQCGLQAWEVSILVSKASLLGQTGHGAHCVEEVREHESEHEHDCCESTDALEGTEEAYFTDGGEVRHSKDAGGQTRNGGVPTEGGDELTVDELATNLED